MIGSFNFWFELGIKFPKEGLQMRKVIMQEIVILVSVVPSEKIVKLKSADWTGTCIRDDLPR